jgi:hypothetical protein
MIGGRIGAAPPAVAAASPAAAPARLIVHRVESSEPAEPAVPAPRQAAAVAPARTWQEELDEEVAETRSDAGWAAATERELVTVLADPLLQGQRLVDLRCGAAVCRATVEHADDDGAEQLRLALFSNAAFRGTQINTVPVDGSGRPATTLYVMRQ